MREDARSEVADLHLLTVQQSPDVVQEALHHELPVQLPDLRYVVLYNNRGGTGIMRSCHVANL